MTSPIHIVVLVREVGFSTKIKSFLQLSGAEPQIVRSPDLLSAALKKDTGILLIDLQAFRESLGAISALSQAYPNLELVGFYPHVNEELAHEAKQHGLVSWPRSKVEKRLTERLAARGQAQDKSSRSNIPVQD